MRILTRYILNEVFLHSLLGLLVFTFVLYIPNLSRLLELVARRNLPASGIFRLFLAPLPGVFVLTLPIAVLVGTLIGLGRMAADGEVIAVRAAGIPLWQVAWPVMLFALLGWTLASTMSLWVAPAAERSLTRMESDLKTSQAAYEIRPRVFIEQFPKLVLYVRDVIGPENRWKGVFLVDSTQRDQPKVTLADSGILVNDAENHRLMLHLDRGATHETDPQVPARYSVISFTATDIPVLLETPGKGSAERPEPPTMSLKELWAATRHRGERQAARVELNYRLALPVASLVLALVGIPLGISTRKGVKAFGLMAAVLLVFIYYIIMAFGMGFAKQGRLNAVVGLWTANLIFAAAGVGMAVQIQLVRTRMQSLQETLEEWAWRYERWRARRARPTPEHTLLRPRHVGSRFYQILDRYVIQGWLFYFVTTLVALAGVYIIFDFFQLLGDIVWHHASSRLVLNYYRYLLPQVIYLMLPLAVLLATLVNFSLLTKSNQITAIKAAGVSLYRISLPVLFAAALVAAGMFVMGDEYLPSTNQRQDALRNEIKGKPAQTFYQPGRKWIFGQSNRIYNYRFFDPVHDVFARLSVFDFDPSFRVIRRVYAKRAFWEPHIHEWILEDGWVRALQGDKVTRYNPFSVAAFKDLTQPPAYFKKDVRTSEQMNVLELRRYIRDLAQSGFDVVRLTVQLYRKFSYPLIALVVALIGIPFAFTVGRKGALSGIALSLAIAMLYWSTSSLFESMGDLSQLPPAVAAWSPDVIFGLGGAYLLLRVRT